MRYWDGAVWTEHVQDQPIPAPQLPVANPMPQMPVAAPMSTPIAQVPVDKASRSGAAWAVILVLVALVFAAAYLIATRVSGSDDSSSLGGGAGVSTTPEIQLPTIPVITAPVTLPGVTLPETPAAATLAPVAASASETQAVVVGGAPLPVLIDGSLDPAVGTPAPMLTGASFDGTPVVVGPGAPTLVVLLAHWCPHCQREVPRLVEWSRSGTVPVGLNVVGIATATDASRENFPPSSWLQAAGFPFPVMADSAAYDAATALGISGFPFFTLIGADGVVLDRFSGEIEMSDLATRIAASLG